MSSVDIKKFSVSPVEIFKLASDDDRRSGRCEGSVAYSIIYGDSQENSPIRSRLQYYRLVGRDVSLMLQLADNITSSSSFELILPE